mgnify:CR=1 FL=1
MSLTDLQKVVKAFNMLKPLEKAKVLTSMKEYWELPSSRQFLVLTTIGLTPEQAVVALGWVK